MINCKESEIMITGDIATVLAEYALITKRLTDLVGGIHGEDRAKNLVEFVQALAQEEEE